MMNDLCVSALCNSPADRKRRLLTELCQCGTPTNTPRVKINTYTCGCVCVCVRARVCARCVLGHGCGVHACFAHACMVCVCVCVMTRNLSRREMHSTSIKPLVSCVFAHGCVGVCVCVCVSVCVCVCVWCVGGWACVCE